MLKVEKINETDSWKTVFYTTDGSVAFHSDGTVSMSGSLTAAEVMEIFDIFKSPRGVDWWRLFAVDQLNAIGERSEAARLAARLEMGNTLPGIAKNQELMRWIRSERLHEQICADAFSGAKGDLWDSKLDEPHTDTNAIAILKPIRENTGISRPRLRKFIRSLQ